MIVIQPGITGGLAEYSGHGGRDENDQVSSRHAVDSDESLESEMTVINIRICAKPCGYGQNKTFTLALWSKEILWPLLVCGAQD